MFSRLFAAVDLLANPFHRNTPYLFHSSNTMSPVQFHCQAFGFVCFHPPLTGIYGFCFWAVKFMNFALTRAARLSHLISFACCSTTLILSNFPFRFGFFLPSARACCSGSFAVKTSGYGLSRKHLKKYPIRRVDI